MRNEKWGGSVQCFFTVVRFFVEHLVLGALGVIFKFLKFFKMFLEWEWVTLEGIFREIYLFEGSLYDFWILIVYGGSFWDNFWVFEIGGGLFSNFLSNFASLCHFWAISKKQVSGWMDGWMGGRISETRELWSS